jgi:hypothetical protein
MEGGRNKLVSRKGLFRILNKLFGGFQVSGKGVKMNMNELGRLHLEVDTGDDGNHPFKVTILDGKAYVEPGIINTHLYGLQNPNRLMFEPVILNTDLRRSWIPVNNAGHGYIALRMRFNRITGNPLTTPWQIVGTVTLKEDWLIRSLGAVSGNDGEIDLPIAEIQDGAVVRQFVDRNISVQAIWNLIYITWQP